MYVDEQTGKAHTLVFFQHIWRYNMSASRSDGCIRNLVYVAKLGETVAKRTAVDYKQPVFGSEYVHYDSLHGSCSGAGYKDCLGLFRSVDKLLH